MDATERAGDDRLRVKSYGRSSDRRSPLKNEQTGWVFCAGSSRVSVAIARRTPETAAKQPNDSNQRMGALTVRGWPCKSLHK